MLTTLENLKVFLGVTSNAEDSLLGILLAGASSGIETYCARKFASSSHVERQSGKGGLSIFLRNYPVTAVSKIEANTGTISVPAWTTISPDSYYVNEDTGEVQFTDNTARGLGHYRVSYTG